MNIWLESFLLLRFYKKRFLKNSYLDRMREGRNYDIRISNQRKKVLVCLHSLDWGGAERFACEVLKFLHENNIPYLIFVEKKTDISEHFSFVNLDLLTYAEEYQASDWQLFNLIKLEKPSILYINHSFSAYKVLSKLSRDIFILDSLHILEYQSGGYPYLSAINSKYINVHHVVSMGLSKYLVDELGVHLNKIKVAYLADKNDKNIEYKKDRSGKLFIGFLGRLEKQKRPELFVELARRMRKREKFHFIMQGSGSLEKKIRFLIEKYKLSNFTLKKSSSDINLFHNEIDILVNCSENEGLTLIGIESLQNSTIFISTDVGQQAEITHSNCLVSVEPEAFLNQVMDLIEKLYDDEQLRSSIIKSQNLTFDLLSKSNFYNLILRDYFL